MSGSVSSIGIGSGLDLQDIMDQLRENDESRINAKTTEKTELESRLESFDSVKSKLLTIKNHALSLRLGSNFLERSASISDEDVLSATVTDGTPALSHSITVSRLATNSSYKSIGLADESTSIYVPTTQESVSGYDDTDTTAVISADTTMTITHGNDSQQNILVNLTSGMTLDDVVNAINTDDDNGGASTYVTASTFLSNGEYYLRITSTAGGTGEDNRVMVTDTPIAMAAPDTTFEYIVGTTSGDSTVSIDIEADTSLEELIDLINDDDDNPGITASVADVGTGDEPYILNLVADSSGEDHRITIVTALDDLALTEVNGAAGASLNAEIEVDSITYERQSNSSLTDIISGVTLNILKSGSANLNISVDYEQNKTDIKGIVTTLNELYAEIDAADDYDQDTGEWGLLARTAYVKSLKSTLPLLIGQTINTGSDDISSLYDLGFEMDDEGNITIDEDDLNAAFTSYADEVITLFIGSSGGNVTGLGELIYDELYEITKTDGLMDAENDDVQDEIDRIEDYIETQTEWLNKRYEILEQQFVALDLYMSRMQSQSAYLANLFGSFTGES